MKWNIKIATRVAVFAALVFIFSYFSVFLYNVNLAFFIVFSAGFLWGIWPGVLVGALGFFLWSNFNPMGPAPFPLLISQMLGISLTGIIGHFVSKLLSKKISGGGQIILLALSGLFSGLIYHLIVDIVDAFIYQPFWPRLIGGILFSLITIISNGIMFPLLYPALAYLRRKETFIY